MKSPYLNFLKKLFSRLLGISSPDTDDPITHPDTLKATSDLEGRRIVKTHLSVDMLPTGVWEKKAKVMILESLLILRKETITFYFLETG